MALTRLVQQAIKSRPAEVSGAADAAAGGDANRAPGGAENPAAGGAANPAAGRAARHGGRCVNSGAAPCSS